MIWTPVGYFLKRRTTRAGWVSPWPSHPDATFPCPPPVEEICSVSNCIAEGYEQSGGFCVWGVRPDNEFGGYVSAAAAWAMVPPERWSEVSLYAYRVVPRLFEDGQERVFDVPEFDVDPLPDTFVRLGYDAVEVGAGWCWGCSPLSCNGVTHEAAVNRYCLVDTEAEGIELARRFSETKPEPGPYGVVEVWRAAARSIDA
ncbi:MAG: hypothetical protein U0746_16080 [Gemmataceae bacterium]